MALAGCPSQRSGSGAEQSGSGAARSGSGAERYGGGTNSPGSEIIGEKPLSAETQRVLLAGPAVGTAITIDPPVGPRFRFVIDETQPAGRGTAYLGHVAGQPGSSGTIAVIGRTIAGTIRIVGRPIYQIATSPNGAPVIRAIDPSRLPPDHPPGFGTRAGPSGKPPRPVGSVGDTCSTDDPTRITVMMLYTTAAKTAAGGTDAIEAAIYAALAEANQSYLNSDINVQLELVHLEEVSYTAVGGDFASDICRMHDPGDGFLDDVPAKRDTYHADLVGLVVPSGGGCGLTYGELIDPGVPCTTLSNHAVVGDPGNVHEEGAYHVFMLSCIQSNFTLPHEFAHSGSARHNWECDPTDNSPTHSNHGYYYDDGTSAGSWRTILTYPASTACGHNGSRVPYFSNPSIDFNGHPTGIATGAQPADNHAVLDLTRPVVANYRCSAAAPANVWMKDTWGDTGAEPDPDPDIMYASPYVWTRNTEDPLVAGTTDRYQHEHEHQNPVVHQPTWAYVKLHNTGPAGAAGHVKLYYADASTSLAWPSAWTQIGDVSVTAASFAAGSTKVVEIPWNDPPGSGHYCLTARWESAADPIPPETSNIDTNTRQSNNVIWRNLEILSTGTGDVARTEFTIRPFAAQTMTLQFVTPGRRPFLPQGEFEVTLKAVGTQFRASPVDGVVQLAPGRFRVTASGGRLLLTILPRGHVVAELRLHRTEQLEHRVYRVTVDQFERLDSDRPPARVGGVAYDLQP
ncbi:MAG TPA: M12 family metallo-peptidase [Kofleriaceae bacterium]